MLLTRRILLGGIGTLPLARIAAGQAVHRLTVLHINDFHSRHEPVDSRSLTCGAGDTCFGGSPRLAAAIREQRAAAAADGRTVVLLDAGDQFQGSLFFTAHAGMAELAVQRAVGVDAMTLGNHEFDRGPDTLGRYIDAAPFPIVSANIDASADPDLESRILPWTILQRGGLAIGVIGLTTRETAITSSPGATVRFNDPAPALAAATAGALQAGAQLLIVLSHLGLGADRRLAAEGVALIIGGHSHTLLSNSEAAAEGPAPTLALNGTPIVQAGCYGRYLGRVDLDVGAGGAVLALAAAARRIGPELPPDPDVAAIVARYAAPLEELRRRPVATLPEALDTAGCRVGPCRLGQIVSGSLRRAAHAPAGVPVVGLMNAGGLRVGLPAGPVTLGQVLDTMPFGNTLATALVSGADLAATVRHGLTMTGRGGYAQWAGVRLEGMTIQVEDAAGHWAALDPAGRYLLATNNFLRTGGDGYAMLRDQTAEVYDAGPGIADLLAEALAGLVAGAR